MSDQSNPRKLTTAIAHYSVEEGVLHVQGREIEDFEGAKSSFDELLNFLGGQKFKMLLNNTGYPYVNKEERALFSKQTNQICTALAVFSLDAVSYQRACIFFSLNDFNIPFRIFREREEALDWLNSLVV